MSYSSVDPNFLTLFVQIYVLSLSCPYICISGFICAHLQFLVLANMSILLEFVHSRMPSRNPRNTAVCCIHSTSLLVGVWHVCDMS